MLIHNAEHSFYYIDPSLASGGDGSSVATAAKAFPSSLNTDNVIYLIRRTSINKKANLPQLSSTPNWSTPKSVVLMGMPKSTDKLFASMPEDAKAAWVDADQDYAYVNDPTTSDYYFYWSNCTNFHMSRICFMTNRENNTQVVECGNTTYGTNVFFDHCWFRTAKTDFTVQGASKVSYYCGKQFFYFNNSLNRTANSAKITNCRIDKYGNGHGIWLGYTKNIYIDNCTFNLLQQSNDGAGIGWYWDDPKWATELKATNITAHYYYSDVSDRYMPPIIRGAVKRALVDTVTIDMGSVQNWSPYYGYYCSYEQGCISLRTLCAGTVVENITATIGSIGQRDRVVNISYKQEDSDDRYRMVSRGQYNVVRNVTVTAIQSYTTNAYRYDSPWNTTPYEYGYGCVHVQIEGAYLRQSANDFLLQNIHVNAPMGNAIYADQAMLDLADCDVVGGVAIRNCVGKIKSINTWYPGYAVNDRGVNTLYVGDITCNKSNPRWEYNSQYSVSIGYHSYMLVGASNIRCYPATYTADFTPGSYPYECNYICTNDQMVGAYFARGVKSKAETWSTYRQGSSSNCSIRLTNEVADDRYWPLLVGGVPFKGITQHVTAGDHTLTFYLTMYGYNDYSEIVNRFFSTIELPNGKRVFSEEGNWQLDTDSVWENLDGYTSYKLTIPFHMDEEGDITTSFQWSWYMVGAATFVDPFPTIA